MKTKIREKTIPFKTIVIHKLITEKKNKLGSTHIPICFLVTIKEFNQARVMFRADSVTELFKLIKDEGRIYL